MLQKLKHILYRRWLSQYFEGELSPKRSNAILIHIKGCSRCRTLFRFLEESLSPNDHQLLDLRQKRLAKMLFSEENLSQDPTKSIQCEVSFFYRIRKPVFITAALLGLFGIGLQSMHWVNDSEFREKSNQLLKPEAQVRFSVFSRNQHGKLEKQAPIIRNNQALAFAYTNSGQNPYKHLLLFGVDENYIIYWYYPAFLNDQENPSAYPISSGVGIELKEEVSHHYEGRLLKIFGLFMKEPSLRVKAVEAFVHNLKQKREPLTVLEHSLVTQGEVYTSLFKVEKP